MTGTIVIGAGVAGLRTASLLAEAGRDVLVLEARDRLGGRLASFAVGDVRFDLGATWFWGNEPRVAALVEAEGIEVFAQHLAGDALLHTADGVRRVSGNPIDVPAGRFLRGADAVTTALARRLPADRVVLGEPVTSLRVDEAGVHVDVADRTHRAASAVLAIAPSLAVQLIDFEPELPTRTARLAARTPVWMGAMTKVVVVFDRPFWRDAGLAGSAISYVGPLREIHDMSTATGSPAALFGFAPSTPSGAPLSVDAVTAQLVELFGPVAADPQHVEIADWSRELYTAPDNASAMNAFDTYGDPLYREPMFDGSVLWASTETSPEAPGHIEGALAAAEWAAGTILQQPTERSLANERR